MPTKQERIWWLGKKGKETFDKHLSSIDPVTRVGTFRNIIGNLPIKRILEVGCNGGHNLAALDIIGDYDLHGIDPFEYALNQATCKAKLTKADAFNIPYPDSYFDLVFTCAVLMHITTKNLKKAIQEICRVSSRYILVIEYAFHVDKDEYYDEFWELVLRWKGVDYLVFRNYKNIISGYKEGGAAPEIFDKYLNPHWWLFELDK